MKTAIIRLVVIVFAFILAVASVENAPLITVICAIVEFLALWKA